MIEVIYFVFDPESDSDVSIDESASSLGAQDFDPESVVFSILATTEARVDEAFVDRNLARFRNRVRIVPVDSADYSQNKLVSLIDSDADVVAFADSDVIYRSDWLARIDRHLSKGAVAVAGPPRFKKGSPLRTTLLLADFGLLWESHHRAAPHVNLHNFALRRDLLETISTPNADYHRFGAPSFIARQLRSRELFITLDRGHMAVHGLNWRIWFGEKRMRRFAHSARMAATDPLADARHAYGTRELRPFSWIRLWWRWARRYQRRVSLCGDNLGFVRRTRVLQHVLLAGLSAWELLQILWYGAFPPLLRRLARRHGW